MRGRTTKSCTINWTWETHISAKDAARIIGCSTQYVNRLVKRGLLTKKFGIRKTLIVYGSVIDFIRQRSEPKLDPSAAQQELLSRICELERRLALMEIKLGGSGVVKDRKPSKLEASAARQTIRDNHPELFTEYH